MIWLGALEHTNMYILLPLLAALLDCISSDSIATLARHQSLYYVLHFVVADGNVSTTKMMIQIQTMKKTMLYGSRYHQ